MKRIGLSIFIFIFSFQAFAAGEESLLFLSPVPLTKSLLTVKIVKPSIQVNTLELRNLIGRELQRKTLPLGGEFIQFTDMESYPNGLYVIIAKDANGKILESTKFVISR